MTPENHLVATLSAPSLSTTSLLEAADILAKRRKQGQPGPLLAETLRPQSPNDAFALQQQVALEMAEPIAGWKCLLPTPDKIVVAPIYQSTVGRVDHNTVDIQQCTLWPSTVPASKGLARVEPELAFVLAQDLPPRLEPYSDAEIDAAIGATHLALELIQSRFSHDSGAGFYDQLADGLFHQGLFLGPEMLPAPGFNGEQFLLQLTFADGRVQHLSAVHPNQQPRAGLYWLVNFLSANNIKLLAGQAVITGSYAGVLDLPFDEDIQFQYGDWGQFRLRFVTKTS
jgi:2-keto-4-pentenoate hydratase